MDRPDERAAAAGAAQRLAVIVAGRPASDLLAARAALRRTSTALACLTHAPALDRVFQKLALIAIQATWIDEPLDPGGA